jgi:hypothetical protein
MPKPLRVSPLRVSEDDLAKLEDWMRNNETSSTRYGLHFISSERHSDWQRVPLVMPGNIDFPFQ